MEARELQKSKSSGGVINAGSCKDPLLMQCIQCMFFIMSQLILVRAVHILGRANGRADAIFRNDLPRFFSQVPGASHQTTIIPPALMELMILQQPDWLSPAWP